MNRPKRKLSPEHCARQSLQRRGEGNASAKLTDEKALWVRDQYDRGKDRERIAAKVGITPQMVTMIGKRQRWTHLP